MTGRCCLFFRYFDVLCCLVVFLFKQETSLLKSDASLHVPWSRRANRPFAVARGKRTDRRADRHLTKLTYWQTTDRHLRPRWGTGRARLVPSYIIDKRWYCCCCSHWHLLFLPQKQKTMNDVSTCVARATFDPSLPVPWCEITLGTSFNKTCNQSTHKLCWPFVCWRNFYSGYPLRFPPFCTWSDWWFVTNYPRPGRLLPLQVRELDQAAEQAGCREQDFVSKRSVQML